MFEHFYIELIVYDDVLLRVFKIENLQFLSVLLFRLEQLLSFRNDGFDEVY